jgi:hypothetical protein
VRAVAAPAATAFPKGSPMNYQAFTNDSLTVMYEAVRGALSADNALVRQGMETRFRAERRPSGRHMPLTSSGKC